MFYYIKVFKLKLDILLKNIEKKKYFGNRKIIYLMRVIEYQHRGMPHAHIVIKLSDMPGDNDIQGQIEFINKYISAKAPTLHEKSTPDDKRYCSYVHKHMTHKCSDAVNGCKATASSLCKRGYDTTKVCGTCFDDAGFPIYERNSERDLKVVPHNRLLLLDWNGHANVEYSAGVR